MRSQKFPVGNVSRYLTATFFEGTLALPARVCRWPYGNPKHDIAYCGREADGSYCFFHDRMAHRPTSRALSINPAKIGAYREDADDFNALAGLVATSMADARAAARTASADHHAIRG